MQYGGPLCRAVGLPEDHGRTTACVAVPVRLFWEKKRADRLPGKFVLLPMRFAKSMDMMGREHTHWIGMDWRVGHGRIVEHEILCNQKSHHPILWNSAQVKRNTITGERLHPDIAVVTREVEWMLAIRLEKRSRKCLACETDIEVCKQERLRVLFLALREWNICKNKVARRVYEYVWGKESPFFHMYTPKDPKWHDRVARKHDLRLSYHRQIVSANQRSWWREMPPRIICPRCKLNCPEICYFHGRAGCPKTCSWHMKKSIFLSRCDNRAATLHKLLHKGPMGSNRAAGRKRRRAFSSGSDGRC